MPDDAVIHLRVPAATKAAWVRESRAAGMRLTDWIVSRIEKPMQQLTRICIPPDLSFADLRLARDPDGSVSFDMAVIARIEEASGLTDGHFAGQNESAIADLITQWYRDLIAEVRLEDERGCGISHQPGMA